MQLPQFSLVFKQANLDCCDAYELSVPQYLHHPVAEYLSRQGCKFRGRWSQGRNRSEFHIEVISPNALEALADRTLANGGVVSLK